MYCSESNILHKNAWNDPALSRHQSTLVTVVETQCGTLRYTSQNKFGEFLAVELDIDLLFGFTFTRPIVIFNKLLAVDPKVISDYQSSTVNCWNRYRAAPFSAAADVQITPSSCNPVPFCNPPLLHIQSARTLHLVSTRTAKMDGYGLSHVGLVRLGSSQKQETSFRGLVLWLASF